VVECLFCKYEALSSNSSPTKKRKKERKKERKKGAGSLGVIMGKDFAEDSMVSVLDLFSKMAPEAHG
jgi:hypothetical protein